MLTAKEIMTRDIVSVSPETEISEAAKILIECRINGLPVVKDGKLVGILCQSDLIAQQKELPIPSLFTILDGFIPLTSLKKVEKAFQKMSAITVADAMTPDPVTVGPDTKIDELASLIVDRNFHTIPVKDGDVLAGVVGKEDILRTLMSEK